MTADPGLYSYIPYKDRPKIVWPGGKKLALWVAPNIEFYELSPPQNPQRKSWPRPEPDVVNYAYRDFGNRVGHWRLMEAMDEFGVRGSVSLSVAMCQHHPEIIAACQERNWEFFSHGIYNTRYTYGMDEAQERAVVEDSIRTVKTATGQDIKGYLAPALTHTMSTMDIIADCGLSYTCDLFHDDQPLPVKVKNGRLISMPYSLEVNDHYAYNVFGFSPEQYTDLLKRHFDTLLEEGADSGTVMCVPLHAYLVGRAHRIDPFRKALEYFASHSDDVWLTTAAEISDFYLANYYDEFDAHIRAHGKGGTA
ncbi:polysaccharide deacetylase family protein [Parvularcula marina]|uniref:Chitooligosaccharide deacetylase n=1 Tax=Parvularcula marina TaxID=2292771 RepID=A0A371RI55_9PROT|nr:polysaccharide deacetylase family protein [Parvularcula marina]RFB05112.1 polysaccharide deacetylase [Parvularcula marina]